MYGSSLRNWALGVVMVAALAWSGSAAAQLVDPACDTNNDDLVDDLPSDYNEGQQYGNLLNFYAVTMGNTPLRAPAPLTAHQLNTSLELAYVPQMTCQEQAVYGGYKTERTNKTYLFPRIRVAFGLPYGVYLGVSGFWAPAFGVTTGMISGELGYGRVFNEKLEVGGRTALLFGHVVGDLAGPLPDEPAVDDSCKLMLLSAELMGGYRLQPGGARLTPYLGLGFTAANATMHVGEDGVDVPGYNPEVRDLLYRGPHAEVGAELELKRLDLAAELYMVPFNLIDPGNPRFFAAPRVRVGYTFF